MDFEGNDLPDGDDATAIPSSGGIFVSKIDEEAITSAQYLLFPEVKSAAVSRLDEHPLRSSPDDEIILPLPCRQ